MIFDQEKLRKKIIKYAKSPISPQQSSPKLFEIIAENHETLQWEQVNYLLQQCFNAQVVEKQGKWKIVYFMDLLKTIILRTFPFNIDNKISTSLIMIYSLKIQELQLQQFQNMAVGICMSEILFSLIENTKINVPQFYSFAYQCVCSVVESSKTIKNFVSFEIGQILQELNKENKKRSYSGIIFKLIELLGKFTSIGNKKANKNIKIVKDIKELLNNHIKKKMSEQETINYQEYIESNLCMQKAENREDGMEGQKQNYEEVENHKIIQVRQLTPKIIDDEPMMQIKKLRKKKHKLQKKIESDIRNNTANRLQEAQAKVDVRKDRIKRTQKKEQFIMQKQTEQAKKVNSKVKKIKKMQKKGKAKK